MGKKNTEKQQTKKSMKNKYVASMLRSISQPCLVTLSIQVLDFHISSLSHKNLSSPLLVLLCIDFHGLVMNTT